MAAPVPVELPALGSDGYFDEVQWQVLLSLIDAVIPSIVTESTEEGGNRHLWITQAQYQESYESTRQLLKHPPAFSEFEEYMKARPLENKRFLQQLKRSLNSIPPNSRRQLGGILTVLS